MRFQALFFLLLLTCMYLSLAQGSYGNCCLRYTRGGQHVQVKMVKRCWMQETDGDCNLRAVVIELKKKGKNKRPQTICVNPETPRMRTLVPQMACAAH